MDSDYSSSNEDLDIELNSLTEEDLKILDELDDDEIPDPNSEGSIQKGHSQGDGTTK